MYVFHFLQVFLNGEDFQHRAMVESHDFYVEH